MHFHLRVITIGSERIDAVDGNTSSAGWDGTHGGAVTVACAHICELRHEITRHAMRPGRRAPIALIAGTNRILHRLLAGRSSGKEA